MHAHKCDGCGHTWEHERPAPGTCSEQEYAQRHTCTECGAQQFYVHYRDDAAAAAAFVDALLERFFGKEEVS
jgi:hypothetical protein